MKIYRPAILLIILLVAALPGIAEERYGKWILEFSVGGYDPADEVRSNASNRATFTEPEGTVVIRADPRPDTASRNNMQIDSVARFDLRVGYGVAEFGWGELILDGGVAYIDGDISNLEVAARFAPEPRVPDQIPLGTPFGALPVDVGSLKQIPVSVDLLVRFRPTKRLNPYGGIGLGYRMVEFEENPEFTQIATFIDASVGQATYPLGESFQGIGRVKDTGRPRVVAPDTEFLVARGGIEFQLRPKWSLFLDVRYEWARDSVEVVVNRQGDYHLGRQIPNGNVDLNYPFDGMPYRLLEHPPIPLGGEVLLPNQLMEIYVEGGELDYGGFSAGFGARFAF